MTTYHATLDITADRLSDEQLEVYCRFFHDGTGMYLPSPDDLRDYIRKCRARGMVALPIGCPTPNADGTCPGHSMPAGRAPALHPYLIRPYTTLRFDAPEVPPLPAVQALEDAKDLLSDPITIVAPSLAVAVMATSFLGYHLAAHSVSTPDTQRVIQDVDLAHHTADYSQTIGPMLLFQRLDVWLRSQGLADVNEAFDAHAADIVNALDTALGCSPDDWKRVDAERQAMRVRGQGALIAWQIQHGDKAPLARLAWTRAEQLRRDGARTSSKGTAP